MNAVPYYDSQRALSEYLLFHYGTADQILPWSFGPVTALNYPVRCVTELLDLGRLSPQARALDLGCAVGRSTFELARYCAEVIGLDASEQFIQTARLLREHGSVPYRYVEEGELVTEAIASVPEGVDRGRVRFLHGDAQALPETLGPFDVVLMANLLDRLPEPARCLKALGELVNRGGQLIITTPCTWLREYTPRDHWLGGFARDGRPVRTLDSLRLHLDPCFELSLVKDIPFLIREHARKFQWSVAMGSRWNRR
jgi:putative 4-mercaptohistidine N1-methyltranferase